MQNLSVLAGATDVSVVLRIVDSTDGTPETGVVFNTSGIDLQYRREGAASTAITEATQTVSGAHTDGGFVHIGNGYYRLDLPDAAVAAGADGVLVHGTVTGMIVIGAYVNLRNAPADVRAFGGTAGTFASGRPEVNTTHWLGTAAATPTVAGVPEVDVTHWIGTAAATPTTAGVPEVDITFINGSAVSASTAQLGVNVVNFGGAAGTFSSGRPEVNTTHISGTAQTANDVGADVNAILADTGTDGVVLSTAQVNTIRDAVTGDVVEAEGSYTLQQAVSVILAAVAGQTSSGGTTIATPNGNATRIAATVDGSNNRTGMTLTPSA